MKKLPSATVRPALKVVPRPGHHMVRFGSGELLVVDNTNNVVIDGETVPRLPLDLAQGGPMDESQSGLGTMWTIGQVHD